MVSFCAASIAFTGHSSRNGGVGAFVPGAADNASGVAAVLALAKSLRVDPVRNTEIVILLTGCEESGLLGAKAWIDLDRSNRNSLTTEFVNIDCIGMGSPRYLGWEVPVVGRSVPYLRYLLDVACDVANELRCKDAGPHAVSGPTDGLAFLVSGISGITIAGFRDGGHFPNYHLMSDRVDNVDFASAYEGVTFAEHLTRQLAGRRIDSEVK